MNYEINEWIEVRSDVMGGKPVLTGSRLDVETVVSHILAGDTEDEILSAFPSLTVEGIEACKEFGRRMSSLEYSVVALKNIN